MQRIIQGLNVATTRINLLESSTKSVILYLFVGLLVLSNVVLFEVVSQKLIMSDQKALEAERRFNYTSNLTKFYQKYKSQQDRFEEFSFYENYENLVFDNRQLNEQYRNQINQFSNITQEQYFDLYSIIQNVAAQNRLAQISKLVYDYYDWSAKRVKIKHDRGFNATHIFAVLTAIEYEINGQGNTQHEQNQDKQWKSLSAQEVIDCCEECMSEQSKMRPEYVYNYIKEYGVTLESVYPYENSRFNKTKKECRRDLFPDAERYYVTGYKKIKNCESLSVFVSKAPVVVGIDARNFDDYSYGKFKECTRKTTQYAVVVGISYDSWKLQNSWGPKWGQRGYIRFVSRNTCGLCLRGTIPLFK